MIGASLCEKFAASVRALERRRRGGNEREREEDALLTTYSRSGARRLGCLTTTSASCSLGSWRSAANELGAIALARRTNPSQRGPTVQTFLAMRRERSVVLTNGWSDL